MPRFLTFSRSTSYWTTGEPAEYVERTPASSGRWLAAAMIFFVMSLSSVSVCPVISCSWSVQPPVMPRPGSAGGFIAMTVASGATFAPMPNVVRTAASTEAAASSRCDQSFMPTTNMPALEDAPPESGEKPVMAIVQSRPLIFSIMATLSLSTTSCVRLAEVPSGISTAANI